MSSMTAKKRAGVIGVVVVALAGAGLAFAAYLSSGAGYGETQSTVAVSSVISPKTPGSQLYPGGTTSYTVNVTNPNAYPVKVTSLSASSSDATGTSNTCPAGTVTVPAVTNPTGTIPAGGTGVYTLAATMVADPNNACQGATFRMPLTAQLASS